MEEREDGDDDAEEGGEEVFDCEDPCGRRRYGMRSWECGGVVVVFPAGGV